MNNNKLLKINNIIKPRLSISRSNNHIYAQIIDDKLGFCLCFSSSLKKQLFEKKIKKASKIEAYFVGKDIGYQALKKGIKYVNFDRGIKKYHGLIKSLAQGARNSGLLF